MLDEKRWSELVREQDVYKQNDLLNSLLRDLPDGAVSDLLAVATQPDGPAPRLAREVLLRLYYERDPRLISDENTTRAWRGLLDREYTELVFGRAPVHVGPQRNIKDILPLDITMRVPIEGGGSLLLGPGDVPYELSLGEIWRAEPPTDNSDEITFSVRVVASDGTPYLLSKRIPASRIFLALPHGREGSPKEDDDLLVERLGARIGGRERLPLLAVFAHRAFPVCYYTKDLAVWMDLLIRRGGQTPDSLVVRVWPHSNAGFGPTPWLTYRVQAFARFLLCPRLIRGSGGEPVVPVAAFRRWIGTSPEQGSPLVVAQCDE
jgi:hypothetical protein